MRQRLWAVTLVLALATPLAVPKRLGAQEGGPPTTCRIGVNVEDVYDVDLARDAFGATLWLWSLCPSNALEPLATIELPTAARVELGEIAGAPGRDLGHYRFRRVQGTFRHDWNVTRYPFDRHRVVIPLDETREGAARLRFQADVKGSFLTPDHVGGGYDWRLADFAIATGVSEEQRSYGVPGADLARYARAEVSFTLSRIGLLAFVKLTAGAFAAAFLSLAVMFFDGRQPRALVDRITVLVGTLFALLVNMRTGDAALGDMSQLTLVTEINLLALAFMIVLSLMCLRDWWRAENGLPVRYPNWPEVSVVSALFLLASAALIVRAAWV